MVETIGEDFRHALTGIIGDLECHKGPFAAFDYLSLVDQLKRLAASNGMAWSADLEDALVHWQVHRMFGTSFRNKSAEELVDASGLLRLSPPKTPKRKRVRALDREVLLDMAFAEFKDVFLRCSSPYPNHPRGVWLQFRSPEDLFVHYDLPPRVEVAYPALIIPMIGHPADLGLLLSGLTIDERTEAVELANTIKVLAALCQRDAKVVSLTRLN